MKASRLKTYVLLDSAGRLTQTLVKRLHAPKSGHWLEIQGSCCQPVSTTTTTTAAVTTTTTAAPVTTTTTAAPTTTTTTTAG